MGASSLQVLERQLDCLQTETEQLRQREALGEQNCADAGAQLLELQAQ